MSSYKFFVDVARSNALKLKLTNKRKKVEVSMGVQMLPEDLADAMSEKPKPKNLKWENLI